MIWYPYIVLVIYSVCAAVFAALGLAISQVGRVAATSSREGALTRFVSSGLLWPAVFGILCITCAVMLPMARTAERRQVGRALREGGWRGQHLRAPLLADVNGSGMADLVGFGPEGVFVCLSDGERLGPARLWDSSIGAVCAPDRCHVMATDVSADGQADLVALREADVWVGLSQGKGFEPLRLWSDGLPVETPSVFHLAADVSGDGRSDLLQLRHEGVLVSLAGAGWFHAPRLWRGPLGDVSTDALQCDVADVNGDGLADLVCFGGDGVSVALSTGSDFSKESLWTRRFAYDPEHDYTRRLADVDGDGRADIVAFGRGVVLALSMGDRFGSPRRWDSRFAWSPANPYPRYASDVNGDLRADIVAVGLRSVWVALNASNGFGPTDLWFRGQVVAVSETT